MPGNWRRILRSGCHGTIARGWSIFQSKDDPEIEVRIQYSVILKNDGEEAAERPISFRGFLF
jgi:hypothetical protein